MKTLWPMQNIHPCLPIKFCWPQRVAAVQVINFSEGRNYIVMSSISRCKSKQLVQGGTNRYDKRSDLALLILLITVDAGHDIMFDLANYAQGWIDWNLLVDHSGGPNHLGTL